MYLFCTGFLVLLPLILGFVKQSFIKDGIYKWFRFYLIMCFLMEVIGFYHSHTGLSNHYLLNLYTPMEFALILLTISSWTNLRLPRLLMYASIGAFFIFWLVLFCMGSSVLEQLDPITVCIEGILIAIAAGYCLLSLMENVERSPLKDPRFWLAGGFFMFYSSTLILNAASELLFNGESAKWFGSYYIYLYCTFNGLTYILYTIALLCKSPNKDFSY